MSRAEEEGRTGPHMLKVPVHQKCQVIPCTWETVYGSTRTHGEPCLLVDMVDLRDPTSRVRLQLKIEDAVALAHSLEETAGMLREYLKTLTN